MSHNPLAYNVPRDTPITAPADLAQFTHRDAKVIVRSKAKYRKLLKAQAAALKPFILANADTSVHFSVKDDTVTVATTQRGDKWPSRVNLTRAAARIEYLRLLKAGFYVW